MAGSRFGLLAEEDHSDDACVLAMRHVLLEVEGADERAAVVWRKVGGRVSVPRRRMQFREGMGCAGLRHQLESLGEDLLQFRDPLLLLIIR